jgi:hypothetical protein
MNTGTLSRISMGLAALGWLACAEVALAQSEARMTARLVDPEKNAAERTATVEVTTSGVELIDPSKAKQMPAASQAHFHYQLDKEAVIATPTPKLSFHELTSGKHTILVVLAGNDHKPIGPQQQLTVTIP